MSSPALASADFSQVVPDHSASFSDPSVEETTLRANHMDMCKFRTETDKGYDAFKDYLVQTLSSIESKAAEGAALDEQAAEAMKKLQIAGS